MTMFLDRRRLLAGLALGGTSLALGGCDRLAVSDSVQRVLRMAERLTMGAQRTLLSDKALAREFTEADLSPVFKANGTEMPDSEAYASLMETDFQDYRLTIDGLVAKPLTLSLAELKALLPPTEIEYVEKQPSLEDVFLAIVGHDGEHHRTASAEEGLR